jgi:ABC-type transporter Mla subunit MlaD
MPLSKLRQLGDQISEETDPSELGRLIAELTEYLQRQQAALDEQIESLKRLRKT